MTASPLQEAIAKALTPYLFSPHKVSNAVDDVLGVLRADDDTRYVKVNGAMRTYLATVAEIHDDYALREIVAAYDAVAPNAKDQT